MHAPSTQRRHQADYVTNQIEWAILAEIAIITRISTNRPTKPALVWSDDVVASVSQRWQDSAPAVSQLRKSVKKYDAWALRGVIPGFQNVNSQPIVILDESAANPRTRIFERTEIHWLGERTGARELGHNRILRIIVSIGGYGARLSHAKRIEVNDSVLRPEVSVPPAKYFGFVGREIS